MKKKREREQKEQKRLRPRSPRAEEAECGGRAREKVGATGGNPEEEEVLYCIRYGVCRTEYGHYERNINEMTGSEHNQDQI